MHAGGEPDIPGCSPPDTAGIMGELSPRAMSEPRVAASYVRLLYEYLSQQGQDAVRLLGPEPSGQAHFVPMSDWQAMLAKVQALEDRPALSLRVAGCISPRHFGVIGYAALACQSLVEALSRLERFHASVYDVNPVKVVPDLRGVTLEWGVERVRPGALVDETAIASLVQLARDMTGRFLPVSLVAFVNPPPEDLTPYRDFFGGEVLFGQRATRLVLTHAQLTLPLRKSDPALLALLDQQAEQLLTQVAAMPAELDAWRRRLVPLIREGQPSLAALAASLHMSTRTLQRHLAREGMGFQQLLDETRQHLAQAHLRNPRLDLAEIALLLGYSEQSAFQRAFKGWTGETPAQWRRSNVPASELGGWRS